jgi:ribosomal protein S27AE
MTQCPVPTCESVAVTSERGICGECWARRGRALEVIAPLWSELHHHLAPGRRGLSEFVSTGGGGSRLPVNATVLDLMYEAPRTLHRWANYCRHERGLELLDMRGKRWGYLLEDALADLHDYDEALYHSEFGVRYLVEIFDVHRRMFSLAGLARLVYRLNAACPACGRRELVRHDGQGRILCARCGQSWPQRTFRRLAQV